MGEKNWLTRVGGKKVGEKNWLTRVGGKKVGEKNWQKYRGGQKKGWPLSTLPSNHISSNITFAKFLRIFSIFSAAEMVSIL